LQTKARIKRLWTILAGLVFVNVLILPARLGQ
jgi:hypothetical protein